MADAKLSALFASNPVDVTPDNLIYVVEDTGGTPAPGGAKIAQLMFNRYKFSVTVSSNDLVVALVHENGDTPSTDKPLYFKIGNSLRIVSAATSITIADGTNWFSSGSPELGGKLVGYFVYVVWDSNSSIVALTISRTPVAGVVADFSATTTNEKHAFNYANFTTTDDVENIGYFEATLSLVATSYLWTVPTFNNTNMKPKPTFVTEWLTWQPVWTATGTQPALVNGTLVGRYKIVYNKVVMVWRTDFGASTTYGTGTYLWSLPITTAAFANGIFIGPARVYDANTATFYFGGVTVIAGGANTCTIGTHGAATNVGQTVPVTFAVSDIILAQLEAQW
jgi:hypothetical protein